MTKRCLLLLLLSTALRGQSAENFILFGAAFGSTQTIGGSNVTVSGGPGLSSLFGFAFQVERKSAVSLWVEPFGVVFALAGGNAPIKGSGTASSDIWTPSIRLMVPLEPRFSVFGAVGAGGGYFHNYTLSSDIPPQLKVHGVYHGAISAGGGVDFRISRLISIRIDARDYVTGRGLGGVVGRNHFVPMAGIALHY